MDASEIQNWRLIDSGSLGARQNMAMDEALARQASSPEAKAVLRLYGWQPEAISLGHHQSLADIDLDRCRRDGVDVVMRPTGGRAVLHADELTYAVVIPRHSPFFDDSILVVYELISRSLLAAFHHLGISAEFERAGRTPKDFSRGELSSLCYASSVQYEIGCQGRKMVGSAQRRLNGVVLQHGSILIGPRHLDLPFYLKDLTEHRRQSVRDYMTRHTITLNELSPKPVTFRSLADAMICGFSKELGIRLQPDTLTTAEFDSVDRLLQPPVGGSIGEAAI
ncbi:lipoate--protein ligase family protein [candidate division KSB1 bacterium]|nr:lipoate--protein ligase family protein [candidate division KSB1 bacterium]